MTPTVVVPVVPEPSVMYFGNRLDEQWYDNVRSGLEKADRDLDMELVDVSWRVDPVAEFRELAASGPEFVVISEANTISFDPSVTSDFPDVQFGVVDGPVEGPNVTSADFANEEGAFLAGVAAAMKTETGTVGFVGAQPNLETEAFRAGFEAGVHSIDEEITVLAIYVLQFADDINGSGRPDLGEARARALYRRDADVVFAVAGTSGLGVFTAAAAESDVLDRQLWAIGADNDQWFEVAADEQRHVLTSIIKRGDLASYRLVEHMLDGGPPGVAFKLGVEDHGFDYSKQGEGLTEEITNRIDQTIIDIAEGRIDVPTVPTGDTLTLDLAGNDIDAPRGVDGFDLGVPIDPGTYEVAALGVPLTLTIPPTWMAVDNIPGSTILVPPDGPPPGDPNVAFMRPAFLSDPASRKPASTTRCGGPSTTSRAGPTSWSTASSPPNRYAPRSEVVARGTSRPKSPTPRSADRCPNAPDSSSTRFSVRATSAP